MPVRKKPLDHYPLMFKREVDWATGHQPYGGRETFAWRRTLAEANTLRKHLRYYLQARKAVEGRWRFETHIEEAEEVYWVRYSWYPLDGQGRTAAQIAADELAKAVGDSHGT